MNGAFYIGAIGLDAQQRALDVVANNIANVNTNGFKRSAAHFTELVSPLRNSDDQLVAQQGAVTLQGATLSGSPIVWTQGAMQQTGQSMDLAINGDGFIEMAGPSGQTLLWRGGTMQVNSDGYLAATDGTPLKSMISVPQGFSALTVGSDGSVSVSVNGATQQIGQIDLVTAKSPDTLAATGNGYYGADSDSQLMTVKPGEEGSGTMVQGSLESSNVQLTDEMTNVLLTQRAFGANAEVVQAGDQLMSIVNQLRR